VAERARIRTLVVDDEPLAREGLRMLLEKESDIELVGEAGSGKEAVASIDRLKPDLVFLDVQMPELDGFSVLRTVKHVPEVVFVTAYDKYAIDAFRVHALDYLLKPFDDTRFKDALDRAKRHLKLERVSQLSQSLVALLGGEEPDAASGAAAPAEKTGEPASRLAIKDTGRVVFLDVEEIDWIESADYYVQLHTAKKIYLHRETMQSLEERLDPKKFVRIHRTAIVNVRRVKELRSEGRRDVVAVLSDGTELKVSRGCRDNLERLV
jgi:two-component system, LytTR family, response regulator